MKDLKKSEEDLKQGNQTEKTPHATSTVILTCLIVACLRDLLSRNTI
jgi:hypothetical protein